jgi:DNA-binding MarR family transcriptional regulator
MTVSEHPEPDFMKLAAAPLATLVAEVERTAEVPPDESGEIPSLATQVADFALAEAIRLIRLGTRDEIVDGAVELSQLMIRPAGETLSRLHPEAYATLVAASTALSAAAEPMSKGGELAVLRSWNGSALAATKHVSDAAGRALPRAELRELMRVEESYLSHLLNDLDVAGLIERVRVGRNVTVHLGARGYAEHVQELLAEEEFEVVDETPNASVDAVHEAPDAAAAGAAVADAEEEAAIAVVRAAVERVVAEVEAAVEPHPDEVRGLRELRQRLTSLRPASPPAVTIEDPIARPDRVACRVVVSADVYRVGELERFETELALQASVVDGQIVEAELWVRDDDWRPQPRRSVQETHPPETEAIDFGYARVEMVASEDDSAYSLVYGELDIGYMDSLGLHSDKSKIHAIHGQVDKRARSHLAPPDTESQPRSDGTFDPELSAPHLRLVEG